MKCPSDSIISEDPYDQSKKVVQVLNISHLLRNLWDKPSRFLQEYSPFVLPSWTPKDSSASVFTLAFGAYPQERFAFDYRGIYKRALRARSVPIQEKEPVPSILGSTITPIILTNHDLKTYGGRGLEAGIYVGEDNSFVELLDFWNLRAAGCYITFLPQTNARRFLPYVKARINRIKLPERKITYFPLLTVWFRGHHRKSIEKLIEPLIDENKTLGFNRVSIHTWNGMNTVPTYNLLNETTTVGNISVKHGNPSMAVQLLGKPILIPKEKRLLRQYYAVSLNSSIGMNFPKYTTNIPALPDLNEWYARKMVFDPFSLRAVKTYSGRTISLITDIQADTVQLNPIEKFEIIRKIFERAGIVATRSNPGLIAERLIALMGGIDGAARIIKITGVRKFIEKTHPLQQKTKREIIEKIRDKTTGGETFKNFENEFGLKGRRPITPEDVFDVMIERNLLQAGIKVRCPKCSLGSWVNLKEVGGYYSCEFCYEKSRFVEVVEEIILKCDNENKRVDGVRWSYRLSGLLGKDDNQQGAIPVILTLLQLSKVVSRLF